MDGPTKINSLDERDKTIAVAVANIYSTIDDMRKEWA